MAESSKDKSVEKAGDASKVEGKEEVQKKKLPQLGALEDDDEFEVGRVLSSQPKRSYPLK